jgi:hypothetical protein
VFPNLYFPNPFFPDLYWPAAGKGSPVVGRPLFGPGRDQKETEAQRLVRERERLEAIRQNAVRAAVVWMCLAEDDL